MRSLYILIVLFPTSSKTVFNMSETSENGKCAGVALKFRLYITYTSVFEPLCGPAPLILEKLYITFLPDGALPTEGRGILF